MRAYSDSNPPIGRVGGSGGSTRAVPSDVRRSLSATRRVDQRNQCHVWVQCYSSTYVLPDTYQFHPATVTSRSGSSLCRTASIPTSTDKAREGAHRRRTREPACTCISPPSLHRPIHRLGTDRDGRFCADQALQGSSALLAGSVYSLSDPSLSRRPELPRCFPAHWFPSTSSNCTNNKFPREDDVPIQCILALQFLDIRRRPRLLPLRDSPSSR